MRPYWLNDDEAWFFQNMRTITGAQQEVLYMLLRQMSQSKLPTLVLQGGILPIDLQAVTRKTSRSKLTSVPRPAKSESDKK